MEGNVRQVWEAFCGKCGNVDRLGTIGTGMARDAGGLAMAKGWGWNQENGYICPACNGFKRPAVTYSSMVG